MENLRNFDVDKSSKPRRNLTKKINQCHSPKYLSQTCEALFLWISDIRKKRTFQKTMHTSMNIVCKFYQLSIKDFLPWPRLQQSHEQQRRNDSSRHLWREWNLYSHEWRLTCWLEEIEFAYELVLLSVAMIGNVRLLPRASIELYKGDTGYNKLPLLSSVSDKNNLVS